MKVIIESATSLSQAQKKLLTDKLEKDLGKKAKPVFRVDPSLIGGLRLVGPQKVVDLSVKARLTQLKQNLLS